MANNSQLQFAFTKKNYQLLFIGIAILILGYALMSGGGTADPNEFNGDELFSARRITLAPFVALVGYVFVGYAIMYKAKRTDANTIETTPPVKLKK